MKRQNQCWRVLSRLLGVLLLLATAFVAYWWFYKLGPARHTLDPEWLSRHSQQEYWREVQKGIYRGMWSHDDGHNVGMYGDKAWAEWIMNHVQPGTSMGCFGRYCHAATAMRFLTNQDVGEDADAWLAWWEKNGAKPQEGWLADGFAQRGIRIDVPPTREQTPMLLSLLAHPEANEPKAIPEYTKYNAFRCLRDCGFDPVAFALSRRTASSDVDRGLLEYANWERRWPAATGVGTLPFAQQDEDGYHGHPPVFLTPSVQITAYTLVFLPLALGGSLILWSFRTRRRE